MQSAVRRGTRDAFFKSDTPGSAPSKADTNLRERDAEKEADRSSGVVLKPTPRDGESYIGFASLPNQVYRKSVKRGFEFTLMVVGEFIDKLSMPRPKPGFCLHNACMCALHSL